MKLLIRRTICTPALFLHLLRPTQILSYFCISDHSTTVVSVLNVAEFQKRLNLVCSSPGFTSLPQRLQDRMLETLDTQPQTANMWECCEECTVEREITYGVLVGASQTQLTLTWKIFPDLHQGQEKYVFVKSAAKSSRKTC
ncbi:hypothetical protein CRENBAI_002779 [Crenichthys baileyi]|uniref:Uncharacterized protein n=1 Tax=Crenichthys baileyi TaxID=28760 RepID=A0AAV9QY22_9TELE